MTRLLHLPLLAWLVITLALAALLAVAWHLGTPTTLSRPEPVTVSAQALRLDTAALGPAAIYGGQSWTNVMGQIARDARAGIAGAGAQAPTYRYIARTARAALTDRTTSERMLDATAVTAALDRLTLSAS